MTFAQEEKYIYGSSRLGVLNESIYLFGSVTLTDDMSEQLHIIGQRTYELTNHLGNVLSVISDKPIPTNEAPIAFEHDFNATNESSDTIYANDFSSGYTGFFADSGITLSLSSGRLLVYNVPHLYAAYYPLNTLMTAGHTYRMKFKVERGGGGPVSVDVDDGTTVFGSSLCSGDGYYEFYCTPTNTTGLQWKFSSPNTATDPRHFYLDDLFIEDVTGVTTASPFTSNTTASVSIDNDKMKVSASSSSGEVFYEMPTVAGDSYKVTCYIDLNSAGDVTLYAKKQSGGTNFNSVTATVNDTYEMIFTAENTLTKIAILNGSGGARDFYVDNFVVEDILVNHDFTSRSFPMNSNSSIVLSLTGGRLKSTGAVNTAQTYQNVPTVIGSTYRVTCTLDLDNGGDLAFLARNVSSGTTIKSLVISTNNTYSFDFIAEETNTQIAIRNDDAATRDFYIDDLTVEEVMVNGYVADIRQASDYSPFGVTLHGRNLTKAGAEKSRFGFNGMELNNELKGEGNSYGTEFRIYDPRVGRWLTLDPLVKKYPYQSPYAAFNNSPLYYSDPTGLEGEPKEGDVKTEDNQQQVYTGSGEGQGWKSTTEVKHFQASGGNGVFVRGGEEGSYNYTKIENVVISINGGYGLPDDYSQQIGSSNSWLISTNDIKTGLAMFQEKFGDATVGTLALRTHGGCRTGVIENSTEAHIMSITPEGDGISSGGVQAARASFIGQIKEDEYNNAVALVSLIRRVNTGGTLIFSACTAGRDKNLIKQLAWSSNDNVTLYFNMDPSESSMTKSALGIVTSVSITTDMDNYAFGWIKWAVVNQDKVDSGKAKPRFGLQPLKTESNNGVLEFNF